MTIETNLTETASASTAGQQMIQSSINRPRIRAEKQNAVDVEHLPPPPSPNFPPASFAAAKQAANRLLVPSRLPPRTQNPSGDQRRCGAAQNDSTPHGGGAPPGFAACARRRQRKRSSARKGWGFVDFFCLKPPDTGREDNLSAEGGAWSWGGYVSGGWWVGV